jgi:hypothetical protein
MPEDLLLELGAAPPGTANLESLERRGSELEKDWRAFLHDVGEAVKAMRGSAHALEKIWDGLVLAVARGRTAEVQAIRQNILEVFARWLDGLKRTHLLATRLRQSHGGETITDPDVLLPEIAALERLRANVLDRWQTPENLERLAVEHYPLSQSQLKQIAATHAPPPEWYAGEEEELFAE